MAKLVALNGPIRGHIYELHERLVLGRSTECHVQVSDLSVSREHAAVVSNERGYSVEDLGSGNGTFINDERIIRRMLSDGDRLRIGVCTFRFLSENDHPPVWVDVATVVADSEDDLFQRYSQTPIKLHAVPADISEHDLREELSRINNMLGALYAVANATSTILEPSKLFARILDYLFDVLPDVDRGYLLLLDDKQQLVPGAIRGRKGEGFSGGFSVVQSTLASVLSRGEAALNQMRGEGTSEHRGYSTMSAPLLVQGRVTGILHLEGREQGKPFTEEDLALLQGIAMQAGVAYQNALMHQRLMRQQRLEQDLHFARQVQSSFLPTDVPNVPGFRFNCSYNPVFQVGGDFYDFIVLPGGKVGVLIGDVAGKGVSAALLMARITSDIRTFAMSESSPAAVMARANVALIQRAQSGLFATMLYLVLDPAAGSMTVCNAGHIPPLIKRSGEQPAGELDEGTNLALGVLSDALFEEVSVALAPGDSVLLCTDGVVEARNPGGEEYGFERLNRLLSKAMAENLPEAVLKDLNRFTQTTPQYDDITLVSMTRVAE